MLVGESSYSNSRVEVALERFLRGRKAGCGKSIGKHWGGASGAVRVGIVSELIPAASVQLG